MFDYPHTAFYGWALMHLNKSISIFTYGYNTPDSMALTKSQEGFNHVYVIWWAEGYAWHGQQMSAEQFHVVFESNKICIFEYINNN